MNKYYMIGSNGDLHDTRKPHWQFKLLRKKYRYTYTRINTVNQLKATIRNGPYAWPGGYPLFFIASGGDPICFDCAKKEFRSIIYSIKNKLQDGWSIIACEINYEDTLCFCSNCNTKIESAYGEEEEDNQE